MEFKIESNVPIPLKKRNDKPNLAQKIRDVLVLLEIGQSFKIPDKKHFNAFGNAKKFDESVKSKTFKCYTESDGYRIFRTA